MAEARILNSEALYELYPLHDARSIRVIDIERARDLCDSVKASMRTISLPAFAGNLREKDNYQALSYSWLSNITLQDPNWSPPEETITINGYPFRVSQTLYNALKRIREKASRFDEAFSTVLWVDAICINQADPIERAQQVGLMGEIYQLAQRLIIWLGETADENPFTLEQSPYSPGRSRIFMCRWFGRRWVLQEVLRSTAEEKFMMFGANTMLFRDFAMQEVRPGEEPRNVLLRDALQPSTAQKPDLLANLLRYRRHECQEEHDRVYALLGISKLEVDVRVDYEMDVYSLYLRLAKQWAVRYPTAVMACSSLNWDEALPSWVPNWSPKGKSKGMATRLNGTEGKQATFKRPTLSNEVVESCELEIKASNWDVPLADLKGIIELQDDDCLLVQGWLFRPCEHEKIHADPRCFCCKLSRAADARFDLLRTLADTGTEFKEPYTEQQVKEMYHKEPYRKPGEPFVRDSWPNLEDGDRRAFLWVKGSRLAFLVRDVSGELDFEVKHRLEGAVGLFKMWKDEMSLRRIRDTAKGMEEVWPSWVVRIV